MNFEEIVQRTVNMEAKAGLKSSIIVRDSDIYYPRDHRSPNSTASKVQTQETTPKNFHQKEPKVKDIKPNLSRAAEASEPLKQARKKKKGRGILKSGIRRSRCR